MLMQEIIEVLESTAPIRKNRGRQYVDEPATASASDVHLHRDYLMRFLDELDAGISVGELRDVLEQYE